ncbi:MAG: peptidoglycan-binding protein [Xanthomonadaceae bacterium]|nr:peptidoglycan-binding protein [Xanthomonadaceae bacterium]TAN09213.1 MAG: peptidoglycan-binding protein [Burkholderiaceae bacterium]MBU6478345.1 peptidoglycan-binding protein [Xanthomonadaceae bacterium]MDE2053880.1 peptidoglycan-binding protein [Xanthomonadaceae bacterium]MDE2223804.1 peptidoglycan-binding protein [Xanthomonadaceae bacterium]
MKNRFASLTTGSALSLTLLVAGATMAAPVLATTPQQNAVAAGSQMKDMGQMKSGMPNMAKLMANKPFVESFQRALVRDGAKISVDGTCGMKTTDALRAFQKAHGLKVTGMVDLATVKALGVTYPAN